jgi:galactokinase
MHELVAANFSQRFGTTPRVFSAPGRVNLIGEHTDYNDGFVLPVAIEGRTYVAASPRSDTRVRAHSEEMGGAFEFDLRQPGVPRRGLWHDYVEGTARTLSERGLVNLGADLFIASTVPRGAGLSSSAALEIAVGFALATLNGIEPDRLDLALAAQSAEHRYVGTLCGIMDQYISAKAQVDHALLIDCRSLTARAIPVVLGERRFVVCDTRTRHDLAASEYNRRREECEQGVALLARQLPAVTALRDVSVEGLELHASTLPDVIHRRCRHVVSENARTLDAAAALERGDFAEMGRLMSASHASLRDDYEVSCRELDLAVATALAIPGVLGSRMTGGGFGGSTVTLVESRSLQKLMEALRTRLSAELGAEPNVFSTTCGTGVYEHF